MPSNKRSDEVDDDQDLPFKLGELVLCRYSSYPYWPATVDQTHQKVSKGKFVRWGTKHDGSRILTFWCTFSNEDTGGWVRADRMVRFHPKLVDKIRVDEDHDFYEDQISALETAEADFKKLYKDGENMPVPTPPDDFESGLDGDDDELESVGEEETPESEPESPKRRKSSSSTRRKSTGGAVVASKESKPKPSKESKSAKRKSAPVAQPPKPPKRAKVDKKRRRDEDEVTDDADDEPPVSRKRKAPRAGRAGGDDGDSSERIKDLEDKLEEAKQTIANLKKRLRKRDSQIAQRTDRSTTVRVNAPASPENLAVPKRLTSKARSVPVSAEKFGKMYKELEECFSDFKTLVYAADNSRSNFERETKAVEEKFEKLVDDVTSSEKKAAGKEKDMCSKLAEILESDISIEALRAHKAGNFIKSMGKACRAMPLINHLCSEIRSTWLLQVKQFMKEQSADQKDEEGNATKGQDTKGTEKSNGDGSNGSGAEKPPSEPITGDKKQAKTDGIESRDGEAASQREREPADDAESRDAKGVAEKQVEVADAESSAAKGKREAETKKAEVSAKAIAASAESAKQPDRSLKEEPKAGDSKVQVDTMDVDTPSPTAGKRPSTLGDTDSKGDQGVTSPAAKEANVSHTSGMAPVTTAQKDDVAIEANGDGPGEGDKSEAHGGDSVDSDKKPGSPPKRQQSASAGPKTSKESDTPRSVAVPPKEEPAKEAFGESTSDSGKELEKRDGNGQSGPPKAEDKRRGGEKEPAPVETDEKAANV